MASRRSNRTGRLLTILLLVLCVTALISCNEQEQNTYNNQGATGIKPFWTYDSNAIGGGGKAMINLWAEASWSSIQTSPSLDEACQSSSGAHTIHRRHTKDISAEAGQAFSTPTSPLPPTK